MPPSRRPIRKTRLPEVHVVHPPKHAAPSTAEPQVRFRLKRRHHSENFWSFFLSRIGAIVLIIAVAFLVGYGFRGIKDRWLSGFHFSFPAPSPSPSSPPASALPSEQLTQGSFSDSFSGTGWMDANETSVARDNRTMVISFKPNITWQPETKLTSELASETLAAARGNGKEVVLVTSNGGLIVYSLSSQNILRDSLKHTDLAAAALTYDNSAAQWVVALATREGSEAVSAFSVRDQKIVWGNGWNIDALRLSGSPDIKSLLLTLGCDQGRCLLAHSSLPTSSPQGSIELATLNLLKLSPPSTVSLPTPKNIIGLTVSGGGGAMLVGITRTTSSSYTSEIYQFQNGKLQIVATKDALTSEYPGLTWAAQDTQANSVLQFYNAYFGAALATQISANKSNVSDKSNISDISYTRFLSARLLGGDTKGEIAADLEPFAWGGTWWAGNSVLPLSKGESVGVGNGSPPSQGESEGVGAVLPLAGGVSGGLPLPTPARNASRSEAGGSPVRGGANTSRAVVLRLRDGLGLDLMSTAPISNLDSLRSAILVPGGDPNSVLAFLRDTQNKLTVYRIVDHGFSGTNPLLWTSVKVNSWDKPIVRARIYRADDSMRARTGTNVGSTNENEQNTQTNTNVGSTNNNEQNTRTNTNGDTVGAVRDSQSVQVRYYLSNDGGESWYAAEPGEMVEFPSQGNDLRYKIELSPASDPLTSPWVTQIGVEYWLANTN